MVEVFSQTHGLALSTVDPIQFSGSNTLKTLVDTRIACNRQVASIISLVLYLGDA